LQSMPPRSQARRPPQRKVASSACCVATTIEPVQTASTAEATIDPESESGSSSGALPAIYRALAAGKRLRACVTANVVGLLEYPVTANTPESFLRQHAPTIPVAISAIPAPDGARERDD
jgi:hypothetical protein